MTSKCEAELKEMTAERDHWRKLAQERGQAITNLQRENERLGMFAKAFTGGAMQDLNKSIESLQVQRDRARADVQRLCSAIENVYQASFESLQTEEKKAKQRIEALHETIQANEAPQLSVSMHSAIMQHGDIWVDGVEETREQIRQAGGNFNPYESPLVCLLEIVHLQYLAGIRSVGAALPLYAYGHAADPRMIADEIIRECRVHKSADIILVSRLPIEWIAANLPDPPMKHNTLAEGLKIRQAEIESQEKRVTFSKSKGISPRMLQQYQNWYDALEEIGRTRPKVFTAQDEDEIER